MTSRRPDLLPLNRPLWQHLDRVALFVLLCVITLRPTVTESYDSAPTGVGAALRDIGDPSPARTLAIDLAILICAAVVAGVRAIRRSDPRHAVPSGVSTPADAPDARRRIPIPVALLCAGTALLVLGAVVSTAYAGNRRLAINASIDWICNLVLMVTLAVLVYTPRRRALLIACIVAAGAVQAAQCFEQYFISFDDTWQHYQSIKADFWYAQGVSLDSERVVMFENRIRAREASGFLPHSNITGSVLALAALAGAGVIVAATTGSRRPSAAEKRSALTERLAPGAAAVCILASIAAIPLTGSRGAVGAAVVSVIGTTAWIVLRRRRRWSARRTLAWTGGAALLVGTAVLAHGLYHRSLPGVSLNFRWQYWTASARMIADHWWSGIGRENFGREYLRYKSIESPEEISTPHNLLVQAACDWGVAGAAGLVLLLLGGSWMLARRADLNAEVGASRSGLPPQGEDGANMSGHSPQQSSDWATPARWLILRAVPLLAVWPVLREGWIGIFDPGYVYYTTITVTSSWLIPLVATFLALFPADEGSASVTDASLRSRVDWVSAGLTAGLCAFLLHDMINFALFVAGSATLFFAGVACIVARPAGFSRLGLTDNRPSTMNQRTSERSASADNRRWARAGFAVAVIGLVVTGWTAVPVVRAAWHLREANWTIEDDLPAGVKYRMVAFHLERAGKLDRLDPAPWLRLAEWHIAARQMIELRDEATAAAMRALDEATRRDPRHIRLWRTRLELLRTIATESGRPQDHVAAVAAARMVLELYLQDPTGHVNLADTLRDGCRAGGDAAWRAEAVEHYREAIRLDGQRLWWEEIRRMSPERKAYVEREIQALEHP